MRIRVCWYKNAGVAGYAETFRPVKSDSQTSEWYSYFENDVLDSVTFCLLVVDQFCDRRMLAAYRAVLYMFRKFDLTEFHGKCIIGKKVSGKKITNTEKVFDGFHCLKTSDHSAHCSDDSGLLTGWYGIFWRRIFEYTSVTWSFSRNISH